MIRIILQFTLRIAFRCVLHRRENQEIHRTEDNGIGLVSRPLGTLTIGSEVCSGLKKAPRRVDAGASSAQTVRGLSREPKFYSLTFRNVNVC